MSTPTPEEAFPFQDPESPDYQALESILMRLIDLPSNLTPEVEGGKWDFQDALGEVVDRQSAAHVALARAMGFAQIKDPSEVVSRMDEIMRLALFWTEGLFIGIHFERERS